MQTQKAFDHFTLSYNSYNLISQCFPHLVNIKNVEGGTSDFVSSLTSGYDRIGYVPVPRPELTSRYRKPASEERNNYGGNVPVPTPDPSSFPTGRHT